jgi:hypothetical protein
LADSVPQAEQTKTEVGRAMGLRTVGAGPDDSPPGAGIDAWQRDELRLGRGGGEVDRCAREKRASRRGRTARISRKYP